MKVVFFRLGDFPVSEFYVLTFRDTVGSIHQPRRWNQQCYEMLAHKIQMPGNHSNERIQHLEHRENLKSRTAVKAMPVIF